jgi:hypothetical protein
MPLRHYLIFIHIIIDTPYYAMPPLLITPLLPPLLIRHYAIDDITDID